MVSDDIFIVFEKVVRIENGDSKPELTVKNFTSGIKKPVEQSTSSLVKSKFPDSNFSVDDNLQILTSNDLDYDFGIDEINALYGSDHDEGIGTESPRSDYVPVKRKETELTLPTEKKSAEKSHVIEKVTPNAIHKKKKVDSSDISRKVVKAIDRIEKIDSSTSRHLKEFIDRSPQSELEKLNFNSPIDLLMQVSFMVHDFEKSHKDGNTRVKAYKAIKFLRKCIKSFVDKGGCLSILNRLSIPPPTSNNCVPIRTYLSFEKWTNSNGEFALEKISDIATGKVTSPLGCAYDSTLGFLFTGPNEIFYCSVAGCMPDLPIIADLKYPSAIVIIRPGDLIGILDRNGIYVYDLKNLIKYIVASDLHGMCRGLAVTEEGLLITCGRVQGVSNIILYDPKEPNNVVKSCAFPVIRGSYSAPNPCFISCNGSSAYITDLGQNCVVCVNTKTLEVRFVQDFSRTSSSTVKFDFVSGIVADSRSNLLIADAQNRSLYYFDGVCARGSVVKVSNGEFPYSASFDVSPCGHLLACCRKTNSMALFRIKKAGNTETKMDASELFDQE